MSLTKMLSQTIVALTGVKVGHSTQHRLVQRQEFELPSSKQAISEVSIDGGKVRLRGLQRTQTLWSSPPKR